MDEQTPTPPGTPQPPPSQPSPPAWGGGSMPPRPEPSEPEPAAAPPPAGTTTAPPTGAWSTSEVPAKPARSSSLVAGWIVIGVVVLVLLIAVVAIATGGSSLPETFGGSDRIDSGPMADIADMLSEQIDMAGVDMDFAIYGSNEMDPRYMILLMEGDLMGTGSLDDQFRQGFTSGLMGSGAQVDMKQAIEESLDGVEYMCVPATAQQLAAFGGQVGICVYQDGDQVGMAMSFQDAQLHGLMDQTQALHDAVA